MSKKLLGIASAIAVVIIIVLVGIYKPSHNKDMDSLEQIIQTQEAEQHEDMKAQEALSAPDSTRVDTIGTQP